MMARRDAAEAGAARRETERERAFRRNLLAVAGWELIWGFGAACVAGPVVMALALQLTPSKTIIGVFGLMQLLAAPALLLSAYVNRRLRRRRGAVALVHALQVTNWTVVGLILLLAPGIASGLALLALIVAHGLIYLLSGLLTAPTYELLSEAFGRRYGTAAGVQLLVNRTAGMLGGLLVAQLLAGDDVPANFGRVLLLGGLCLTLSNLAVLAMVEPPPRVEAPPPPLDAYLSGLGATVRAHRDYLIFLGVSALLAFITVVQGFYTTFALERLGLPVAQAGLFTAVTFAATGLGGLTGGLGDRWGHRRLLAASLLAHAAATAAVLAAQPLGPVWFYAGLAASGAATAATSIATTNLMVDFAPPGEKGAYAAVGRLATLGAGAVFTPLGGWLIDGFDYAPTFGLGIALTAASLAATRRFGDPRLAAPARTHHPAGTDGL
jgi:MFS family permease